MSPGVFNMSASPQPGDGTTVLLEDTPLCHQLTFHWGFGVVHCGAAARAESGTMGGWRAATTADHCLWSNQACLLWLALCVLIGFTREADDSWVEAGRQGSCMVTARPGSSRSGSHRVRV